MAIRKTDKVTLNGSTSAYGGLIISASYSIGFGTQVTQLTLTISSENGAYTISEDSLNVFDSDKINLGSRELNMVAIEYSIDDSVSGRILTVTYNDKSILLLDKKFVALLGRNFNATATDESLILVGRGYFTLEESSELGGDSIPLTRSTSSQDVRQLPDYLYNLEELLGKIRGKIENIDVALARHDNSLLKETTGTLRNVLSSWGSIYGFTFFFNESGKIQFIDLTESISPVFPNEVNFISEKNSFSLRDTISKGHSVYYGKPGKNIDAGGGGGNTTSTGGGGETKYGEFEEKSDTQIYLYRPTDRPDQYWANPGFAINLGKAAAVGESFFAYAALYLCKKDPNSYSSVFGYEQVYTLNPKQKKAFDPKDDLYEDYNIISYIESDISDTVTVETVKQKFAQFLTYENNLAEAQYFRYNWAIGADLKYDREDITEYVNPDRKSAAESNHRIYATIPWDLSFDVYDSVKSLNLNKSVIFLEVSSSARYKAASDGYNPNLKFAAVLKNINFTNIFERINFKYELKQTLRVEGQRIDIRGSIDDGGGGGDQGGEENFTAALESIAFTQPSYNSNTIRTDVDLDTSPNQVAALSDIIQVDGNNIRLGNSPRIGGSLTNYPNLGYTITQKKVQKTFTINNIDIPNYTASIEKGLQNVDISISSNGVKTTYTIGNRNFTLPSKELITQPRGAVIVGNPNSLPPKKNVYSVKSSLNTRNIEVLPSNREKLLKFIKK